MTRQSIPTRTLPDRPDLNQLKRQARELLDALRASEPGAVAEVEALYRDLDKSSFALHDAQLVIARAYGYESWPKLKAYVEGATVRRLIDAVRAGSFDEVRVMLKARPELARMSIDNLQVLHHAVLARSPELVRILMAHGADARDGVYPHREATTPHAIAVERGYDEIVGIIEEEEQRRRDTSSGMANTPAWRRSVSRDCVRRYRPRDCIDGREPRMDSFTPPSIPGFASARGCPGIGPPARRVASRSRRRSKCT